MNIIGMNTYPWIDDFAWGQFFKMTGFALFVALVASIVIGLIAYWLFRDNQIAQCATCGADTDTSRGVGVSLVVFVILLVSIPTLYRLDDSTVNNGNSSSNASASSQQVASLEDEIGQQLEARAAGVGYEVVGSDVDSLTATVQVGECEVVLDLSDATPEFVVRDDVTGVQRFAATHPFSLLRDARQDLEHPLRTCFTPGQLDSAAA